MLAWDDVKDEFTWEGSLRDICLQGTTVSDWQAVWRMLRSSRLEITYAVDSVATDLPEDVAQTFALPRENTLLLTVLVAGVGLNCHFFDESEIEFDLDPRQVSDQRAFDAIVAFMADLANASSRVALMTPESMHDHPFLRVPPAATPEYHPTGGFFSDAAKQHEEAQRLHSRRKQ
jgi:hypothetical protein